MARSYSSVPEFLKSVQRELESEQSKMTAEKLAEWVAIIKTAVRGELANTRSPGIPKMYDRTRKIYSHVASRMEDVSEGYVYFTKYPSWSVVSKAPNKKDVMRLVTEGYGNGETPLWFRSRPKYDVMAAVVDRFAGIAAADGVEIELMDAETAGMYLE